MAESPAPARKAGVVTLAATAGGTVGGATALVAVWLLSLAGVAVPDNVADAFTILATALLSLAGGWLVPPGTGSRRA
jgi:hypothetical protein